MYVQLDGTALSHNKTLALLKFIKKNYVRFYPSKEQHNGGRCNKTILSQPSPSEEQQQLQVVVRAWAADECTRMAHTKNKKLPKMARRISFQPNPGGRASWSHGLGFPQLCALVAYLASGPSRGGPAPHRLYSTAKKNALLQTFGLRQPQNGFDYITHKQFQSNSNASSGVIKLWVWEGVYVGIQNLCKMSLAEQQLALSSSCGCCRTILFYGIYSQQERERI